MSAHTPGPWGMTPEKVRRILSIAKALDKQAQRADEYDIQLSNGGIVGSLLGEMADELRQLVNKEVLTDRTSV